ncbi:signal transduction histidine kinase [Edaphobacter aggregans]|uniref:histidine kinase n=1 Tax=Edaphobacter aggregans TaxID=570835 RepID=A0A3R9PD12_9BACT|nr:ATP-binding protein [Edaphobacter aggregans]RSL18976.1 signal transduction histidine kinase [Edaphobacter aggregans]
MKRLRPKSVRTRLTLWYVGVLASILAIYIVVVCIFQYTILRTQIYHDMVQDMETVEGLLYFDGQEVLRLRQDYYSHPQSHLLVDRLMEVRELTGNVLYRSDTLNSMPLGSVAPGKDEGATSFDDRTERLADGTWVLIISHRHPVAGRILLIRLGYSLSPLASRLEKFLLSLLLALPPALALAGFAGYRIACRALAPLESMASRAEKITANNLSGRLQIEDEHDELGRMAAVINSLLSRLERSFLQLQRFTADAAHELKTPLASIRVVGEASLRSGQSQEAYRDAVSSMLEETSRLNQTVEGLLMISKAEAGEIQLTVTSFSLRELVEEIIDLLDVVTEERDIAIVQRNPEESETHVTADRTLLRACVLNVLHNAVKFSPANSIIVCSYQPVARNTQRFLRLSILDQGPGIAAIDQNRVFERFFRGGEARSSRGEGVGLGLAIAKLAIETTHGCIYFDAAQSIGALCHIEVPIG